jgi:hypothetical protein
MPAFTFEKISPPVPHSPPPATTPQKPRGIIIQILGRFVEARVKRSLRRERRAIAPGKAKSPE